MANVLAHRGPDGEGSFAAEPGVAFGHRRLAIIDLSDAGIQPFASDDGQLQLLHNGEIYNYRELRRAQGRGHRFHTATDTEVVLHAYEEWGDRCVERFNGMWAIALWDGARRLFCSRDRFGVQAVLLPLSTTAGFVFASELKAFRVDSSTPLPRRTSRGARLPRAGASTPQSTFFEGSSSSSPRTPRFHRLGRGRAATACSPGAATRPTDPSERYASCFRTPCGSACAATSGRHLPLGRGRFVRDRVHGRPLSREIANARPSATQRTFTACFEDPGFDERPFAREVVAQDERRDRTGSPPRRGLVDDLGDRRAQDEPFRSTSIVAQWYVMRGRSRPASPSRSTAGGDEVLAGYPTYFGSLRRPAHPRPARHSRVGARGRTAASTARLAALARPLAGLPRSSAEAAPARAAQRRRRACAAPATLGRARRRNPLDLPRPPPPVHGADPHRARPSPSCSTRRTSTRWRTRSKPGCRSSTTGSWSSLRCRHGG